MKKNWISFTRKKICAVMALLVSLVIILSGLVSVSAEPAAGDGVVGPEGEITAEAVILIDSKSGFVMFEKNPDKKMYPASTTKMMTALVALDAVKNGEVSLADKFVLSQEAFETLAPDGSSIYLKVGEAMTLDNLLKGLLIASGNDAAVTIAEGICGSIDEFVVRMNNKAAELGLENTHFVNPHGLHDENHYTTARELSVIAREAMKNETFREIVESAHIYLDETNMTDERRYYINTNNLVSRMRYPYYFYEYATGIKTGSTSEAGSCLVSSAEKDGLSVISVVLNSEDNSTSHYESIAILKHGLNDFEIRKFAKRDDIFGEVQVKQGADGIDHIILSAENNLEALFPQNGNPDEVQQMVEVPEFVTAPLSSGQVIGKVSFVYKEQVIGTVNLISTMEVERSFFGPVESFFEWLWSFTFVRIVIWVILGAIILFVLLLIIGFAKAVKKSKRKNRRHSNYRPPRY